MKCFAAMAVMIVSVSAAAQDEFALSWTRKPVDGRMTGVVPPGRTMSQRQWATSKGGAIIRLPEGFTAGNLP